MKQLWDLQKDLSVPKGLARAEQSRGLDESSWEGAQFGDKGKGRALGAQLWPWTSECGAGPHPSLFSLPFRLA